MKKHTSTGAPERNKDAVRPSAPQAGPSVTTSSESLFSIAGVRARIAKAFAHRQLRFLCVGGFNTIFGPAVFVGLHFSIEHDIGYLGVLTVSWVIAVFEAFLAYRYIVFRVRGNFLLDLARFSLVYVGLYLLNLGLLPLLVEGAGMPVLLAAAATLPVTTVASYLFHNRFSFRRAPT